MNDPKFEQRKENYRKCKKLKNMSNNMICLRQFQFT